MFASDTALFGTICADFEDILPTDLHDTLSKALGAQYLQETNDPNHQKNIRGIAWGTNLRAIISLHVQITESILTLSGTKRPVHIHFLYLAASPQTFLSDEALRVLGIEDLVVVGEAHTDGAMRLPVRINGYTIHVQRSPSDSHFTHLNILGQDFVRLTNAKVFFGGQVPRFEISFP